MQQNCLLSLERKRLLTRGLHALSVPLPVQNEDLELSLGTRSGGFTADPVDFPAYFSTLEE